VPSEQAYEPGAADDAGSPFDNACAGAALAAGEAGLVCNTLDPFGMSLADEDDLPFDAPDLGDDPLAEPEDGIAPDEVVAVEAETPPRPSVQPPSLRPPLAAPTPSTPGQHLYLERAREAARAQSDALQRSALPFSERLKGSHRLALLAAAGLAVPLLGGLWALQSAAPAPQDASAATQSPPVVDLSADYETARAMFAAGDSGGGVASLERAAEGGLAAAQYDLAQRYERGEGVSRNAELARSWTQRAAEAGHCRAMHDVGVYLARGEGVAADEAAASRWFVRAAEFGVADSQYNLGVLYQQGRGVREDLSEALYWYLVAARQHDIDAIDRAVEVAAQLSLRQVAQARLRAHAFEPRPAVAAANPGGGCAGAADGA